MTDKWPSHGRFINRFNALGPYLRKQQSNQELYFFDCLSECLDAGVTPELREFYGWWMELSVVDDGFIYEYWYGFYDRAGEWNEQKIPQEFESSTRQSLLDFYGKLTDELEALSIELMPSPRLDPSRVLAA
ncbi:MAG: Sigma factor-binding protein Crl [Candidatus Celerinatantimonas neptuna]|nr:MAG: Sigma factor-binding protein Crl [Candidatus Celerinatantimonas neptuna]